MNSSLKAKALNGVCWSLIEKFSTQAVSFSVSIILARMLSPTDYGTVALLSIFTAVASVLASSGFGNALIQKKDATELDYNSVFYLSVALSCVLYAALFFVAPLVARYYGIVELKPILRVASVMLLFNSINSVQNAELSRKLLFHLSFRISLISTLASAVVGITLAYLGYGPWALVWAGVSAGAVGVIARWFIIAWRPKMMFSISALQPLWRYGWKMMVSSLLDTGFNNLYGLIIGKVYTRADLSFVNKGRALPELLMNNINGTLGSVAFPVLSQIQDDKVKLREAMRRMMLVSTFFVFPLMAMLALLSERIILLLYGEKWIGAVPYAQIACVTFALWPFHTINLQGVQAIGRSDVFLKLEIIKKFIALVVLVLFLSQSVMLWCVACAFVTSPLSVIINAWPNRRLLGYTLRMQLKDVLPTIGVTMLIAFPVWALGLCFKSKSNMALFIAILTQMCCGLSMYLLLMVGFKTRAIKECVAMLRVRFGAKNFYLGWLCQYLEK